MNTTETTTEMRTQVEIVSEMMNNLAQEYSGLKVVYYETPEVWTIVPSDSILLHGYQFNAVMQVVNAMNLAFYLSTEHKVEDGKLIHVPGVNIYIR